jgi:hypothetical protein
MSKTGKRIESPVKPFDRQLIEAYALAGLPAPDSVAYTPEFEVFADDFVILHRIPVWGVREGRRQVLSRILNLRRAKKFPTQEGLQAIAKAHQERLRAASKTQPAGTDGEPHHRADPQTDQGDFQI